MQANFILFYNIFCNFTLLCLSSHIIIISQSSHWCPLIYLLRRRVIRHSWSGWYRSPSQGLFCDNDRLTVHYLWLVHWMSWAIPQVGTWFLWAPVECLQRATLQHYVSDCFCSTLLLQQALSKLSYFGAWREVKRTTLHS